MSPLLVLQARAEARALLFRCVEFEDIGEAITPLLVYAHENALNATVALDVIKTAFGKDWIETK